MNERRYVAYFRVSTVRQGQSGLGLEAQRTAVLSFLGNDADLIEEHVEIESGKKADRPKLLTALASCKKHGAKLIIAKLDRLARNVAFVSALMEAGIEFVAVDNPHASKLTIHILCAVAEHEREMISERTKAALAVAKARGVRLGNPSCNSAYKHIGSVNRPWNYYVCNRRSDAGNCSNWNVRVGEANYQVTRDLAEFLMLHMTADTIVERIVGAPKRREEAITHDLLDIRQEANKKRQQRRGLAARFIELSMENTVVPEVDEKLRHLAGEINVLEAKETEFVRELAHLRESLTLDLLEAEEHAQKAMSELARWDRHSFVFATSTGEAPQLLLDVANAAIDNILVNSLKGYPDRIFRPDAKNDRYGVGEFLDDVMLVVTFKDPDVCIPEVVQLMAKAESL